MLHFDDASLLQLTEHSIAKIHLLCQSCCEWCQALLLEIDQDDAAQSVNLINVLLICSPVLLHGLLGLRVLHQLAESIVVLLSF
ncbi:MAG: hypothetical protein JWQ42_635 [Edaphobacter sp.]|nr:hypothetical protein [Edaphobacter sp.]